MDAILLHAIYRIARSLDQDELCFTYIDGEFVTGIADIHHTAYVVVALNEDLLPHMPRTRFTLNLTALRDYIVRRRGEIDLVAENGTVYAVIGNKRVAVGEIVASCEYLPGPDPYPKTLIESLREGNIFIVSDAEKLRAFIRDAPSDAIVFGVSERGEPVIGFTGNEVSCCSIYAYTSFDIDVDFYAERMKEEGVTVVDKEKILAAMPRELVRGYLARAAFKPGMPVMIEYGEYPFRIMVFLAPRAMEADWYTRVASMVPRYYCCDTVWNVAGDGRLLEALESRLEGALWPRHRTLLLRAPGTSVLVDLTGLSEAGAPPPWFYSGFDIVGYYYTHLKHLATAKLFGVERGGRAVLWDYRLGSPGIDVRELVRSYALVAAAREMPVFMAVEGRGLRSLCQLARKRGVDMLVIRNDGTVLDQYDNVLGKIKLSSQCRDCSVAVSAELLRLMCRLRAKWLEARGDRDGHCGSVVYIEAEVYGVPVYAAETVAEPALEEAARLREKLDAMLDELASVAKEVVEDYFKNNARPVHRELLDSVKQLAGKLEAFAREAAREAENAAECGYTLRFYHHAARVAAELARELEEMLSALVARLPAAEKEHEEAVEKARELVRRAENLLEWFRQLEQRANAAIRLAEECNPEVFGVAEQLHAELSKLADAVEKLLSEAEELYKRAREKGWEDVARELENLTTPESPLRFILHEWRRVLARVYNSINNNRPCLEEARRREEEKQRREEELRKRALQVIDEARRLREELEQLISEIQGAEPEKLPSSARRLAELGKRVKELEREASGLPHGAGEAVSSASSAVAKAVSAILAAAKKAAKIAREHRDVEPLRYAREALETILELGRLLPLIERRLKELEAVEEEVRRERERQGMPVPMELLRSEEFQRWLLREKFGAALTAAGIPVEPYLPRLQRLLEETRGLPLEERQRRVEQLAGEIIEEPRRLWQEFARILEEHNIPPEDFRDEFEALIQETWGLPYEQRLRRIRELAQRIAERVPPPPPPPPPTAAPTAREERLARLEKMIEELARRVEELAKRERVAVEITAGDILTATYKQLAENMRVVVGTDVYGEPACVAAGSAPTILNMVIPWDNVRTLYTAHPETREKLGFGRDIFAYAAMLIKDYHACGAGNPDTRMWLELFVRYMARLYKCEKEHTPQPYHNKIAPNPEKCRQHPWCEALIHCGLADPWIDELLVHKEK